ncbi:MAG TPA: Gfo/Idh/MocA family oxidoreductase [Bacteroidia bacterium]
MTNIALIGAGQLGSRHLQALALLKQQVSIQVIDPSADSLKTAELRFKEVSNNFKGKISFHTEIAALEKNIEIAVVATNSKVRRIVTEHLVAHSTVKNLILEKFLFTKESDYDAMAELLATKNINAWVNCPRRMMPFYQQLQQELKGAMHFTAVGNNWGLGCNGIHLLDLFAYLSRPSSIELSNNLINKPSIESKREGYVEFTGTITGHAYPHSLHITSFAGEPSPLQIIINTPTAKYSIQEGPTAKVWISRLANKWEWEEQLFTMPFQSQLTNLVVEQILNSGTCSLTTYEESSRLHVLFLNNLLIHLRKINNDNSILECPIT